MLELSGTFNFGKIYDLRLFPDGIRVLQESGSEALEGVCTFDTGTAVPDVHDPVGSLGPLKTGVPTEADLDIGFGGRDAECFVMHQDRQEQITKAPQEEQAWHSSYM